MIHQLLQSKINSLQSDSQQPIDLNSQDSKQGYDELIQKIIDSNYSGLLFFYKYLSDQTEQFIFTMRFIGGDDFKQIYKQYGKSTIEMLLNRRIYVKLDQYFVQISGERECKDTSTKMVFSLDKILESNKQQFYNLNTITTKGLKHNFVNLIQNFEQIKIQLNSIFEQRASQTKNFQDYTFIQLLESQFSNQLQGQDKQQRKFSNKLIFDKFDIEIIIRHILCKLSVKNKLGPKNYNTLIKNIMTNFVSLQKNEYTSVQTLLKNIKTSKQTESKAEIQQTQLGRQKCARNGFSQFTQQIRNSINIQMTTNQNNTAQRNSKQKYFQLNNQNKLNTIINQIPKIQSKKQQLCKKQPAVIQQLKQYISEVMGLLTYLFGKLFYLIDSYSEIGMQKIIFFNSEYIAQLKKYQLQQSRFKYYFVQDLALIDQKKYLQNLLFVGKLRYIYKGNYQFRPIMNCTETYNVNAQSLMQVLYKFVKPQYAGYKQQVCLAQEYQYIQAMDIKAAYDVIDQQLLFQILLNRCGLLNQHHTVYKTYKFKRNQFIKNTWQFWKTEIITSQNVVNLLQEVIFNTYFIFGRKLYKLSTGVPQGSILSPLFCYVYYQHLLNETIYYNIICANISSAQSQGYLQEISVGIYVDDLLISSNDQGTIDRFFDSFSTRLGELAGVIEPLTKEDTWCNYDLNNRINVFNIKNKINAPAFHHQFYLDKLKGLFNKVKISLQLECPIEQYLKQTYKFTQCARKLLSSIDKSYQRQRNHFVFVWIQYIRILITSAQGAYLLSFRQHNELKFNIYSYAIRIGMLNGHPIYNYVKAIIKNCERNKTMLAGNIAKLSTTI